VREQVKIGIIGTSWWTDLMYVPSFTSHPQAEVVAVSGRQTERASEIAQKFGGARVYSDYRDLIASDVVAVVIAVPDDLHYDMTMAAIAAGRHVLCEKPLANNAADARAMLQAAVRANVKHMVLFTWRWQPHWRYLKRLVDEGFVGRCHHARFQFLVPLSDGGYQWRFDGSRANGVTGDLGSHMIDFAQWMIGDVTDVMADMQMSSPRPRPDGTMSEAVNDAAFLTLGFAGGAHAQVHVSAIERLGDQVAKIRVAIYGDKGAVEVEHVFLGSEAGASMRGITEGDAVYRTLTIPADLTAGLDPADLFSPYKVQSTGARLFVDSILNDTPAVPDFSVGVKVQQVVDAALLSSATGRRVSVGGGSNRA
jgi:predicted dehydrogenase